MKRIDVYTSANCGPCRLIKPFLEELEGVDLNYIDLETKRVAFQEYGVTIDTLVLPLKLSYKNFCKM